MSALGPTLETGRLVLRPPRGFGMFSLTEKESGRSIGRAGP